MSAGSAERYRIGARTRSTITLVRLHRRFQPARCRALLAVSDLGSFAKAAKARRLLAEADDLLQAVIGQIASSGGRVRLGASASAQAHLLPRALDALAAQHPEIDVQVAVMPSEEALARLAAWLAARPLIKRPLKPALSRALDIAHRARSDDEATAAT